MASTLSAPHFTNEAAALAYVEAWLWPQGPVCPFCGETSRLGRLAGKTTRPGLCKCYTCQKPFTVKMGTVFEHTHAPLHLWLQAIYLLCSSKKGISTRQLQRTLGVGAKTAWHMGHRIRLAMTPAEGSDALGGPGVIVEGDDTELAPSRKTEAPGREARSRNQRFVTLVERGGRARSIVLNEKNARIIGIAAQGVIDRASTLHSDGGKGYRSIVPADQHEVVIHKDEYARDGKSGRVHTNSAEGHFSIFKRGLVGIYQHMSEQHLQRYLAEFDFRQNTRIKLGYNDESRTAAAVRGAKGKRLTYKPVRASIPSLTP